MLWFPLWTALLVGTAAAGFHVARTLRRSGKAAAHAWGESSERLAEVADRAAALSDAAAEAVVLAPVALDDPAAARDRRALVRLAAAQRRAARRAGHEATQARWRSFSH